MPPVLSPHYLVVCRDLYLTYALMVLESFNYFSTSLLLVLYLTQEFGVSDIEVRMQGSALCLSCMPCHLLKES